MGWKDLYELSSQMTEAEIRFEKRKRLTGLFLGPLVFLGAWFWPPLPDVSPVGMRALAIVLLAVVWWITEAVPIPVTSLLLLPLTVVCGVFPYERAFGYWAHWTNLFLIGAFLIGGAMETHGLTRRVSLALVSSRIVGGDPWRLLVLFLLSNIITGAFTSNTVDAVLYMSVGIGLLKTLNIAPGSGFGTAMFLGIAWATNIGGKLTPSGSVPNMVAIALANTSGYRVGYLQWVLANFTFTALQTSAMLLVLWWFLDRKERDFKVQTDRVKEELAKLGPFSRGEKAACCALAVALFLWTLPDIVPMILGRGHPIAVWLSSRLNWGVVALLVGGSLFLTPIDWRARRFAMTWEDAVKNIEWGTLALVAGSLAIAELVADKNVGLGQLLTAGISGMAEFHPPQYLLVLGIIVTVTVLAQVTSGVALVSAIGPLALLVGPALSLNPIALLVTISLAANMGYTLPSSTPPNAIVFASGYLRIVPMFVRGSVLALIGIVLLSLTGYQLANWVFPWPLPSPAP
ncbi:MAG TPA: SLC13 family permease [Terriglobia bacterium]|nr:SLC13 family permease [Terriglobia bacterium]